MTKQTSFSAFLLLVSAFCLLTAASSVSIVQAQERQNPITTQAMNDIFDNVPLTLTYDVATDARTFRINRGAPLPDAKRGDSFIVEGKIYPGGTLPVGGTLINPGTFNPDTASGSIGKWVLRGTFNADFAEIMAGAEPAVFGTQYFIFNDGRVLISDGPHAGSNPQLRPLVGGGGTMSGVTGDVKEELLGTNITGLFNQRFTFKIKRQSIR
ncbi:MAG: hypothetical protein JNK38_26450 [Acidobacteria bacterium]|nr:hypothetical protein [Acidobacteriota bacterium]